jgi:hypothetical protein
VLSLTGVPIARDMQLFFVPQRRLLWTALQAGHLPLWTPLLGNGTPLLANFQSGVFYPPNWVYAVLPFFEAFNGLLVLHFVVGGASMYLFARAADYGRSSAGAAAVGYMLGGYFVSLTNLLNVLQAAAWAPAVCWAILVHAKSRTARSFALLVTVLWLAFIAGEPLTFALAVALGGRNPGGRVGGDAGASHRRVRVGVRPRRGSELRGIRAIPHGAGPLDPPGGPARVRRPRLSLRPEGHARDRRAMAVLRLPGRCGSRSDRGRAPRSRPASRIALLGGGRGTRSHPLAGRRDSLLRLSVSSPPRLRLLPFPRAISLSDRVLGGDPGWMASWGSGHWPS